MRRRKILERLWRGWWRIYAERGLADGYGSSQYRRLRDLWRACGRPGLIGRWMAVALAADARPPSHDPPDDPTIRHA